MAKYLAYRDGNKTDEVGFYRLLSNLFTGEVVQGLEVTQDSPLAMTVEVSSGDAMLDKGTGYKYHGWSDSVETVTVTTSNPSFARIDVVVAYADLSVSDAINSNSPNGFVIQTVDGTASASPTAPNDAAIQAAIGAGNPYVILAEINVPASATTISTADITDQRVIVSPRDSMVSTSSIADSAVTYEKRSTLEYVTVEGNSVSATSAIDTKLTFSTLVNNQTGWANLSGDITVDDPGVYVAVANMQFNSLTVQGRLLVYVDGVEYQPGRMQVPATSSVNERHTNVTVLVLAAGQTVSFYGYQNQGSTQTISLNHAALVRLG